MPPYDLKSFILTVKFQHPRESSWEGRTVYILSQKKIVKGNRKLYFIVLYNAGHHKKAYLLYGLKYLVALEKSYCNCMFIEKKNAIKASAKDKKVQAIVSRIFKHYVSYRNLNLLVTNN